MSEANHKVVIVGGGFGGLYAAKALKPSFIDLTLVDKRNFHLFQPLLYQVATGGLSPADISSPFRAVLKRHTNTRVLLDKVIDIEPSEKRVRLESGSFLDYDSLVVATGASHSYFGHSEWERFAPGLKTIEEATDIRSRILMAFEQAEKEKDEKRRQRLMTFAIVGAGPTGVEMAGAIGELAHATLKDDFRDIDTTRATIYLLDALERVLPPYPEQLSEKAKRALEQLGVTIRTGAMVTKVDEHGLTYKRDDESVSIETRNVFWAAGVKASSIGHRIAEQTTADLDSAGRVHVSPYCTVKGYDDIFVIGDLAHFETPDGEVLPGVAAVAIDQGKYVADVIKRRIKEKQIEKYSYQDRGRLAVIGRNKAVAAIGRFRFSGAFAWVLWLFVHLMYLVEFSNRLLVFIQWGMNYTTRNRGARLISGKSKDLPSERYWERS
jgi:NADH dehydrogenase